MCIRDRVGYRGVLLIGHGGFVPVLLGIGVLGLPVVGAAILVQELRFGRDTERLAVSSPMPAVYPSMTWPAGPRGGWIGQRPTRCSPIARPRWRPRRRTGGRGTDWRGRRPAPV